MTKKELLVVYGKKNNIWAELNIDIDPFVIVLDTKGKVVIAKLGNDLAVDRGGSLEISYKRAKDALSGTSTILGGSRIYWRPEKRSPRCKFLGAIGVSGLSVNSERDNYLAKRLHRFHSHRDISLSNMIFSDNLNQLRDVGGPYFFGQKREECGCYYPDAVYVGDDAKRRKSVFYCVMHGLMLRPLINKNRLEPLYNLPESKWQASERKRLCNLLRP